MATGTSGAAARDLETLLRSGAIGGLCDEQLLERFLASKGEDAEDAFRAVVERHGPMVMGVCRRVLGDADDADDAFQATFLVLARKARSIARGDLLANWLHGVAVRTARELKATRARRLAREGRVNPMRRAQIEPDEHLGEIRMLLDEELNRLPDAFRSPVLLCDLEGKTHQEAARILGLPVGTVSSRLVRARDKLRKRLIRRGLTLSAGEVATVCAQEVAQAAVPPALVAATARGAVAFAATGATGAAVPASLAALALRVGNSLLVVKLAASGMTLVLAVMLASLIGAVTLQVAPRFQQEEAGPFQRGVADDWSWVDQLPNADAATKARFKRCARSALENYARLRRLVADFDLTNEYFINDGANHFTFGTRAYKGKLYWNDGAVRYDFEGESPFGGSRDAKGRLLPARKGTYSVLRTSDMAAQIEDHVLFGVVLKVDPPPKSLDDWMRTFRPLRKLDPWVHYAACFRPDSMTLKELASGLVMESKEDGKTIVLELARPSDGFWSEITCDKASDDLPVHWRAGQVQQGQKLTFSEQTNEWMKTDGVWYPVRFVEISYIGLQRHPTKEYDLRVSKLRANTGAKIPGAVFTLSDLPMPEGYGGWDNRKQPPIGLIRSNGIVREHRPSEPLKSIQSGPVPFPKIIDMTVRDRVVKEDYLSLLSEYGTRRREADKALMQARATSEQAAALDGMKRLESGYAGRFLAIAENHSGDQVAFDALGTVAVNHFTPRESERAAEILIRDHLRNERMVALYGELDAPHLAFSTAAEKLLRSGMAAAPTREAQARACLGLARHFRSRARSLRQIMGPGTDPFLELSARASGGNALKEARPGVPEVLEQEAERLYVRLAEQFSGVPLGSETMGDEAQRELFKLRVLAIGKPAPEVDGPDVFGKPMKLSDYRGKVVVLTFNAGWPRGGKYPLERSLAERMKGRPLAVLSVNVEDDKERLLRSIKDGEVTWPCWWEGTEAGANRQRWRVNELPSVFVIDAGGILRAKEVEGKALDEVVDRLVRLLEEKRASK